jgi:hypothetical protein
MYSSLASSASGAAGRVHRCPAVAQRLERDTLHALLVHDRVQLVLHLGPAAADLVEEDAMRAPQRGRRAQVFQAIARGHREADQVVERQQARVVVPVLELQRRCQALEQRALGAAMRADQQHRRLGRKCGEHRRVEVRQSVQAQAAQQPSGAGRRRGFLAGVRRQLACGLAARCVVVHAQTPGRPCNERRRRRTGQGRSRRFSGICESPRKLSINRAMQTKRPSKTRAACLLCLRRPDGGLRLIPDLAGYHLAAGRQVGDRQAACALDDGLDVTVAAPSAQCVLGASLSAPCSRRRSPARCR